MRIFITFNDIFMIDSYFLYLKNNAVIINHYILVRERNKTMQEYDFSKVKRNVERLRKERGITQEKLGEIIGVKQGRISVILKDNSNCFTLSQIIAIAEYFKVSVDELLGLNEEKQTPKYETLSDIANALFSMARSNTGLSLGTTNVKIEEIDHNTGYPDTYTVSKNAIYFENDTINKLIGEWAEIRNLKGVSCKNDLLDLWEEKQLEKTKENKAVYKYQNLIDYVREIYDDYYKAMQKQNVEHAISRTDFDAFVQYWDLFMGLGIEPINLDDKVIFHIDEIIEFYKEHILPF